MSRSALVVVVALLAPACTQSSVGDDIGDDGGGGGGGGGSGSVELTLSDLEPGWLVHTTRVSEASTTETTQVSDGTSITLTGSATDVFVATVTDGDGNLVATHSMQAPCTMGSAHQLHVPGDYATIQAAVDAASPGDTVKVGAGTYHESVVMRPGICLLGAGANKTILDAQGQGINLIDLTNGAGTVVSGFQLRGVGGGDQPQCNADIFNCSGDWYRAAIYVSLPGILDPAASPPPIVTNNVFVDNDIALMLYFHGLGVIRNNVFVDNRHALVANHFQDRSLVANNVFYGNTGTAIANQAAYLDIVDNIIARSGIATRFEYIQTGWIHCNLFFENSVLIDEPYTDPPTRYTLGTDGNIEADPHFVNPSTYDFHLGNGSPGHNHGCYETAAFEPDGSRFDIGAYGGPLAAATSL
ncbi:MAG: hypothetical protein HOV81_36400 [Kofleriaceae bacterium]|nr:hypothetical protein [Kofleriaceae bacterium]